MKAQQLKNAILQLAIQGKLVPQDPNDEPASVLLEKIQVEKEKLIAEGKIKKSKKTSDKLPYTQDDFPFEIPESWVWVTLENITSKITDGSHNPPSNKGIGIPLLSAANIFNNKVNFDTANRWISEDEWNYENKRTELELNDILLTIVGTIGRTAIIKTNQKFALQRSVAVLKPVLFYSEYLSFILQSPYLMEKMTSESKGTAQKGIYLNTLKNLYIPLPPLNEQKRIVAKLEEILPFIDEYDKKEQKLIALHQQFPEQLKKSILQSAIQGKLVEQDPNDEPASELVKRIQAEKERLISEKKIKKPKVKSEIVVRDNLPFEIVNGVERCIADEVPFEIPESWVWARLGNVSALNGGFAFKSQNFSNVGSLVVRISDFNNNGFLFKNPVRHNYALSLTNYVINKYDILIAMTGGTVGKSYFVTEMPEEILLLNQRVAAVRAIEVLPAYANIFINSGYIKDKINSIKNSTNDNISMEDINNFFIPIPPLNEQKRIVQKIEELFSCIEYL